MIFKKDIAKIIARKWMLAATSNEKKLLNGWRTSSDKNEAGYATMKHWWDLSGAATENEGSDEQIPVDEFFLRAKILQIGRRSSKIWKVAASIAVLVALSSLLFNFLFMGGINRVVLMANAGQQTEAILPDGSHVWLNSGSKLIYEHNFGRIRALDLKGEAFFIVSSDRTSPFIVDAGGLKVRATGTQFNVRHYPDETSIETTLLEGGVKLKTPNSITAQMRPGQTVAFEKVKGKLVRLNVKPDLNIAWKEGVLVFNNTSFDNLVTRLQRWYNINIVYDAGAFEGIHYSGTIRNLRLDQVFNFINLTIPIEVQLNDDNIILTLKQSTNEKNKLPME